jgi:hypothetical protein
MQLMSSGFNNIQNEWFNSCVNVNNSRDAKKFTNSFKYKCEALRCVFPYTLITTLGIFSIVVSISSKWMIQLM